MKDIYIADVLLEEKPFKATTTSSGNGIKYSGSRYPFSFHIKSNELGSVSLKVTFLNTDIVTDSAMFKNKHNDCYGAKIGDPGYYSSEGEAIGAMSIEGTKAIKKFMKGLGKWNQWLQESKK